MSATRRKFDQYFTPASATRELLRRARIEGEVFECCVGDSAIASELSGHYSLLWTNDIDESLNADFHEEVSHGDPWLKWHDFDWVVSNPPFNCAPQIIPLAYEHARVGIAMLLRLSFLEPCFTRKSNRAAWLAEHPPTQLIVLPRISFTGDGKTDNVTCAWFVWDKRVTTPSGITIVPRSV